MFQFRNIFYPLCYGNNLVKVRLLLLQISILVGLWFDRNISMIFYILRHVTLLHQCQCTLVSGRFKLMTSFDRLMTSNQELKKVMSNPEFSSGRPRSIEVTKGHKFLENSKLSIFSITFVSGLIILLPNTINLVFFQI